MIVDAHAHFWDPNVLSYPWLSELPVLHRPYLPDDYSAAATSATVERIVFVECNCLPEQNLQEVELIERLAAVDERISGIVAHANLIDHETLARVLDALEQNSRVAGIRHNIQGQPLGFCVQPVFMEGVREAGRRGLTFDLCATHDQLEEVVTLVRRCPDTRLVLDHCGKPAISESGWEPWRTRIAELAESENVWCKLSGLLTQVEPAGSDVDVLPWAHHVVDCFGTQRTMYGSDWPVLTLAGTYEQWFDFTRRLTAGWSLEERGRFYHDNAIRFYGL